MSLTMRPGVSHPHVQKPAVDRTPRNLDRSTVRSSTQQPVLQDAIFPTWKDDTGDDAKLAEPTEMARQDPLGIQMWKLYSRTKAQLPNQERMDNLTWRMMGVNLKRKEQEQARLVL